MTSEGAFPVLGPQGSVNLGTFVPSFTVLPSAPPVPGPPHRAPWQQRPPNLPGPVLPPGSALVLPAFPSTPLVAGQAGRGPGWPGAYNLTVPVRPEQRPVQAPQAQTIFLPQATHQVSTPGALGGGAVCPAPQFLVAPAGKPILPAPPAGTTQASHGGWSLPRPHQPAVPATQLASGSSQHGAARSGGPACWPPTTSPGNACTRTSVYEKYRRWQHYKPLARRHLPHSPDTEALSCFLIPVLRTLARLKPTMTLEEGLSWALQEWRLQSNSDRHIYYEMARKFMEFEAEEVRQMQTAQRMTAAQGLPPPATHRPGPRAPPAPERDQKRARIRRKAGPGAQPASTQPRHCQKGPNAEAPTEIPPEAVREYMDTMEWLLGPGGPAEGAPGRASGEDSSEPPQGEEGAYPDPGLLSYVDELCSQEEFITKVWAVLHPRFLADVLSPETQLDLCALAEELEQEEGLSLAQLQQKRLLALKQEEGAQARPSHGTPRLDSRPSEMETGQDSRRHGHGPQRGDSDQACPPDADCGPRLTHSLEDAGVSRPKAAAASPRRRGSPPLKADRPRPAPQAQWRNSRSPGPGLATAPGQTCPAREPLGPTDRLSEDEEELRSLDFLLASQDILPSWGLPQSPTPGSDLLCPRVPRARSPQRPGLSPAGPPAAKTSSRPPCAGPGLAEKTPPPGASLRVTGRPALALGLGRPSQPQKRGWVPFVPGNSSKRHCSQ
ncbi:hypothetical protein MC885_019960 [Smutsia gigantea]|nr:hypothetical protein MC885_019959 [Smutsia gigantea]KAK2501785.1 hypothetical protein MC885_019960 [Smutsia gigantea]